MELLELDRDRATSIQKHQPNSFKSLVWVCLFFLGLSTLLTLQAKAQTLYGSVVGTVTDNTGAAVPGANVVITDIHTNDARTVTSDNSGVYTISTVHLAVTRSTSPKRGSKDTRPPVSTSRPTMWCASMPNFRWGRFH